MKKLKKKPIIVGIIVLISTIILITNLNSYTSSETQDSNVLIDTYSEIQNEEKDINNNSNKSIMYDSIKDLAVLEYPSENEEWCYNVYTDNTGTYESKFVELTECKIDKNAISISIPNEIEGFPVICIGDNLLSYYEHLEKLTIPDTIINIGNKACYKCRSLSDIKIPNSVTVIGDSAFDGHGFYKIGTLEIPEGVIKIGESAFYSYDKFEKVILPKSLKRIHYDAFRAKEVTVLNPNLEFVTSYEEDFVFSPDAVVYGYSGSTAAEYCAAIGNVFKVIEEP